METYIVGIFILIGLAFQAWAILGIRDEITNSFLWHRDWLRAEKNYKRKFFELQTDLESEKRESALLKLELDVAQRKFNLNTSKNATNKDPSSTVHK